MDDLLLLIQAQLEGELTPSQLEQLQARLRDDPATLAIFVQTCRIDQQLRGEFPAQQLGARLKAAVAEAKEAAVTAEVQPASSDFAQHVVKFFVTPTPLSVSMAVLVIGVVLTAMAFIASPVYRAITRTDEEFRSSYVLVAKLTGTHEAVWAEGQIATHGGAHLLGGHRMELLAGRAEIAFRDGATVVLQGPSTFILHEAGRGELQLGTLTAKVPPRAIGFAIETPQATLVDMGTEFGVCVESQTNVHATVFNGSVLVKRPPADGNIVGHRLLVAGQSVQIERGRIGDARPREKQFSYARNLIPVTDGEGNFMLRPTTIATVDDSGKIAWNGLVKSGRDQQGAIYCSLLQFDLASHPIELANLRSAKLRFRLADTQQHGGVMLRAAAEPWNKHSHLPRVEIETLPEPTVSFATTLFIAGQYVPPSVGEHYEVDVTPFVRHWLQYRQSNFGFVLRGPKSNETGKYFTHTYREFSSAVGNNPPLLVIEIQK